MHVLTPARLATVAALLFLSGGWGQTAARAQDAPAAQPIAITHGPYLQLPSDRSVTVVWHTNRRSVSRVEYGAGGQLTRTAVSSHNGLIDNQRTSHVVTLTGLEPGTTYRYRVVSREFLGYEKQHIVRFGETVASDVFSFTTLDTRQPGYSFAVVSDIHENPARLEKLLAPLDLKTVPFVVFNGDMVNDFMDEAQPFTGFLDAAVGLFARATPFVYVRGNHDVRGRFARQLADYFPTSPEGRAYYSFDHGPVHFVVLDSGEDKEDSHQYYNGLVAFEDYRREQARWLAEDLRGPAARLATFRVVFSHIPPYGGDSAAVEQVREAWEPVAARGRVDLWISGHLHKYMRFDPTRGRNGFQLLVGAADTAIHLEVTRQALRAAVVNEAGRTVDRVSVTPR